MLKQLVLLTLLAILLVQTQSKITIHNLPEDLKSEFQENISYSIGNFGQIPYGSSGRAPLRLAEPEDGCSQIINTQHFDEILPFILIKRGGCHFTEKVLNAAQAGAKMAIIMDNIEENTDFISMADDGQGNEVYIPSILISEDDGLRLFDIINEQKLIEEGDLDEIELQIDFNFPKQETTDLRLYINPPLKKNYNLLLNLQRSFWMVEDNVKITPVYELYKIPYDEYLENPMEENCISDGLFCARDMDEDLPGTGAHVAEEYLFQLCVHRIYGDKKWFQYIKLQYESCYQIANYGFCRIQILSQLDIDQAEMDLCMIIDQNEHQIQIHEEQLQLRSDNELTQYPLVMINYQLYRGSFSNNDVIEAICASQVDPSQDCEILISKYVRSFEQLPDYENSSSNSQDTDNESSQSLENSNSGSGSENEENSSQQSQENEEEQNNEHKSDSEEETDDEVDTENILYESSEEKDGNNNNNQENSEEKSNSEQESLQTEENYTEEITEDSGKENSATEQSELTVDDQEGSEESSSEEIVNEFEWTDDEDSEKEFQPNNDNEDDINRIINPNLHKGKP